MIKINWRVRAKNKIFWATLIPAVLLLGQSFLKLFNIEYDPQESTAQLLDILENIFIVLSLFGIVNDPTTKGGNDSTDALTYDKPK